MKGVFKEMPAFERNRETYFTDDEFQAFEKHLLDNPQAGDVIQRTGGLRKVRWKNPKRGKGQRGGSRIIYYWFEEESEFWLLTVYDHEVADDLTTRQKATLKELYEAEIEAYRHDKR